MKAFILLIAPVLLLASCSTYDPDYHRSVAMERDETRLYNAPSHASNDPSSPLYDVMLQRGRVGMTAARF